MVFTWFNVGTNQVSLNLVLSTYLEPRTVYVMLSDYKGKSYWSPTQSKAGAIYLNGSAVDLS